MASESKRDISKRVLVTGAGGFLASHIIKQLSENGYEICGTVRNAKNAKQRYRYLYDMAPTIELFEADLSIDKNWDQLLENVSFVIHTANPMLDRSSNGNNDDDAFIKPALNGMRIILNHCLKNKANIKRFVYTSSVAACLDFDNVETISNNIRYISTKIWTNVKNSHDPYAKSKTLAEQYAWDFIKQNNNPFELVVLNPGVIFGPLLTYDGAKSLGSNDYIKSLLSGEFPLLPDFQLDMVDVRDVALAHVKALDLNNKKINGNRYLLINQSIWIKDAALLLKFYVQSQNKLNNTNDYYPIIIKTGPNVLYKLIAYVDDAVRNIIAPGLGQLLIIDNRNTIEDFGIIFTRVDTTIQDTAKSLIGYDIVKKQSRTRQVIGSILKLSVVVGVIGYAGYKFKKYYS